MYIDEGKRGVYSKINESIIKMSKVNSVGNKGGSEWIPQVIRNSTIQEHVSASKKPYKYKTNNTKQNNP